MTCFYFTQLLEDGGYQEGGQALLLLVDGLATDTNTQDEHPVTNLLQQQLIMSTLFSGIWVTCLTGGYNPRHFTPYLPQDHGRPWD
jgi:hypothetical protein